ncbi:MAG: MerR family transcriptional regulator [Bacteroidales bacterium]|nr:MerR family transcriptional regulator [Bacteroidales bacterium]
MEKLYYSISEVAEILGESVSLVRFWSNSFPKLVKPVRNAKGNRQYTTCDIEALKQIHHLVKEKGLTLDGAARRLAADRKGVDRSVQVLDSLKEIRARLIDIKNSI